MNNKITANQTNPENIPDMTKAKFENEAFQYIEPIWQTTLLVVKDEDKAIRLVQDTFVKAFGHWNHADCQLNCRSLLFKTLAKLIFPENKWQDRRFELGYDNIHLDDQSLQPKAMSCHTLSEALARLRPEIRFVTILSLRLRFNFGEIAEIIGSEFETAQTIVYTGRRQLHLELIKILNKSTRPDSEVVKILN
jgi:DNA-directed RNA polymerase specialized sigma24 family protein